MLGVLTPVILRHGPHRGSWGGFVLAAGSGGGIAGALAAGLVLLPGLGIERSYLLIAVVAAMAAAPAMLWERRWPAAAAVAVILAATVACWMRHDNREVLHSQKVQNEVVDDETGRVLLIDGLPQTGLTGGELLPGDGLFRGYLLEAALMMGPPPRNALVVGLGGGLAPRVLAAHRIECRTVEVDPAVVKIAREEFDFDGHVIVADGRSFLSQTDKRFDLIVLDVCTSDSLAWHLFTREAMQAVRQRLFSDGLLVIQFIGDDGPWSASLSRTVGSVFGDSLMLTSPGQLGGVGPRWLFASPDHRPRVPEFMFGVEQLPPWEIVELEFEGELLTDDHFPAEMDWARTAMRWRGAYGGE
jgi:spermidine synthase